jgi:hypothetical protein
VSEINLISPAGEFTEAGTLPELINLRKTFKNL